MKALNEWRSEPVEDPGDDIIESILPDSPGDYLLVTGRSGLGKTNLMLNWALHIVTGKPIHGLAVKQGRVGYLGFEGSRAKLLARLDKIAANFSAAERKLIERNFCVELSPPYKLLSSNGERNFRNSIHGLRLIFIDPLRYFTRYQEVKDASPFLDIFKKILVEEKVVAVIIHHLRKRDNRYRIRPESLEDEVKGAGDWVDCANSVLLLERATQPRQQGKYVAIPKDWRTLYFVKSKDAKAEYKPLNLIFNRATLTFDGQDVQTEADDDDI